MNIIYFTMKNLNENRAFLAMLGFLFVFSCSKDKKEGNGNGNGNGDATKYTLSITKPTGGTLTSDAGGIRCGSKGATCKAEFEKGAEVTLTAKADTGYVPAAWQGACDKTKATESTCKLNMDANKTAGLMFGIDTDGDGIPNETDPDDDGDKVLDETDVDDDNDGLMEIHDLDMFNHIQHSLAGTAYKTGADATNNREGAPEAETDDCTTATMDGGKSFYLCGYELARDLDFAEGASYAGGSVNTDWRPDDSDTDSATNEGFSGPNNFAGIFEGNGNSISNLYSRGGGVHVGLFRSTTLQGSIRNLGVVDANLYVSNSSANSRAGGLVGHNLGSIVSSYAKGGTVNRSHNNAGQIGGLAGLNQGSIRDSHATGAVNGGDGNDRIGGLVGRSHNANIVASYATGVVNGGAGDDNVGGLVGLSDQGTNTITASYATGAVNGGAGIDNVGGLVGDMRVGTNTIIASYATGAANGNAGGDIAGGLVGFISGGSSITASYATGAANGGAGDNDDVGGLVGLMSGGINTITASYATGAANGNAGSGRVGALVGAALRGGGTLNTITHSYGFGSGMQEGIGDDGTPHPAGLSGSGAAKANGLSDPAGNETTDAAAEWDQIGSKTKDAWDFGTTSQAPALKYADYDGPGASSVNYCALFPDKIPGTDTDLVCGTSLLPDQPGR